MPLRQVAPSAVREWAERPLLQCRRASSAGRSTGCFHRNRHAVLRHVRESLNLPPASPPHHADGSSTRTVRMSVLWNCLWLTDVARWRSNLSESSRSTGASVWAMSAI